MKFALDTLREVIHGGSARRVQALFGFSLWFVAGAFLVSTVQFYLSPAETTLLPVVGGTLLALGAGLTKLS